MMQVKLYELVSHYKQVQEMADDLDQQTLLDTLDAINESIEDKAENSAKLILSLNAEIAALKQEEKRLAQRRKNIENKVDTLKSYLQIQMELAGIEKVKRPTITIQIRTNPGKVNILDEKLIPSDYMITQEPIVSKEKIAKSLKEGMFVPGAELIREKGLSIK